MFPKDKISAFEVSYQDRKQLKNLQNVTSGPYFGSVQEIVSQLKKTMSPKLTLANGMALHGGDLVKMIRKLFTALENGDIPALETAYVRLEKQMCDSYYFEWVAPLLRMSEDKFMNETDHHLTEFERRCKIELYTERVKQEIRFKRDGIIQEREGRRKAEEAQKKAEEEERRAQEARRIAEEEQRRADEERRIAEEERKKAEKSRRREEAERKIAQEKQRQAEEQKRQEAAMRKAAEESLARER